MAEEVKTLRLLQAVPWYRLISREGWYLPRSQAASLVLPSPASEQELLAVSEPGAKGRVPCPDRRGRPRADPGCSRTETDPTDPASANSPACGSRQRQFAPGHGCVLRFCGAVRYPQLKGLPVVIGGGRRKVTMPCCSTPMAQGLGALLHSCVGISLAQGLRRPGRDYHGHLCQRAQLGV